MNLSSNSAPWCNRAKPSNGTAEPSFLHWPTACVTKAKLSTRSSGHRHREERVAPSNVETCPFLRLQIKDFGVRATTKMILQHHYTMWWVRILTPTRFFCEKRNLCAPLYFLTQKIGSARTLRHQIAPKTQITKTWWWGRKNSLHDVVGSDLDANPIFLCDKQLDKPPGLSDSKNRVGAGIAIPNISKATNHRKMVVRSHQHTSAPDMVFSPE